MIVKSLTAAAAAAGLAAIVASHAGAAPFQSSAGGATALPSSVIQVHGFHRDCRRGPGGWHRHNKWGQRRACRPWAGKGKRPDYCVKVGPLFYCDF